jgi:hypothetical protein
MADIFISHIHEEAEASKALSKYLGMYGLDSFLSSENWQVRLGERWFNRITEELEQARIVILMLSSKSVRRPWINFEAGWAWSKNKVTIPACFGGLNPGEMPRPYSDLQGLDLTTGAYTLVLDCHQYLKGTGFTMPPPIPNDGTDELLAILKRFTPRMPPPS